MEIKSEQRTFSDYPSVDSCLDNVLAMYEAMPDRILDYTLETIWKWLDDFSQITLLVYNEELGRYKKLKHAELKDLLRDAAARSK